MRRQPQQRRRPAPPRRGTPASGVIRRIVRAGFRGRPIAAAFATALALAAWEFGGSAVTWATDARASSRATMTIGERFEGRVRSVVDGDTFWMDAADVRIRVWGLGAPETSDRRGAAATAATRRLVDRRRLQCLTRDIDRFGRIVGQCWTEDGRDVAAAMIASGTAVEFCRFSRGHYGTC